ncbi:MAG: ribonuclease H-like domain-containing protein [Thermoflexales bacterium]|nr:ribonuclease H-like domain-containing protein [Thermoflexales bacterium]MDW8352618.1 ribonuclease H-like domain-containing protein [Anaerolineae bacterium]
MNLDLRERLRRLGAHKNISPIKPSRPALQADHVGAVARAQLEPLRTPFGWAYVSRSAYVRTHRHGDRPLDAALCHLPKLLAKLALGSDVEEVDVGQALFLDTETTGLNGGAGTLAFLVGMGYFDGAQFVVEQFFLRDPAEESAMLYEVGRRIRDRRHVVTFNGQAFDVPLLESRFILSRIAPPFADKHHLDLLLPARRIWRGSLESCSLSSLEFHLLGVRRGQRDVPGAVIPFLYREYLATGGGDLNEDMQRVMYHNEADLLSMVTLVARLADAVTHPQDAIEHFNAARFYERIGDYDAAERSYRAAASDLPASALRHVARFMQRRGHSTDALAIWERLAESDDVEGLIEVAKYYEWRACDPKRALAFARRAMRATSSPTLRTAIAHRIARLERKAHRARPPES